MTLNVQEARPNAVTTNRKDDARGRPSSPGERMAWRLRDLIDQPYSWVPSYAKRYEMLLKHCEALTPHQAYAMTMLLGPDSARGYDRIPNTFALTFPEAHRVDLTGQVGWYYFAGNVRGTNGAEYGLLYMMFQYTLLPPPIAAHFGLSPVENQVVDVQLAITSGDGRMYQAAPPFYTGTDGSIEVADRFYIRAGDNVVDTPSRDRLYPMTLRASGVDRGGASPVPVAIDIRLVSGKGIVLQGNNGCMPCIGGVGTRYYSIPQMAIDPVVSRITIGDAVIPLASGTFWMDHQWGTGMVPGGASPDDVLRAAANLSPPHTPGWDFMVMNFDDGSAMTLNHLHTPDDVPWLDQKGETPPPPRPARPAVGKFMDRFGTVFDISGTLALTAWARGTTSPDPSIYPVSNVWFPHGWSFELCGGLVPAHLRKLTFRPISADPSAMFFANTSQYVEAPVTILDATGEPCGRGYAEAVGYENFTATAAVLAGLTAEEAKSLAPVPPSAGLKLASLVYATLHKKEMEAIVACGSLPPAARDCACP